MFKLIRRGILLCMAGALLWGGMVLQEKYQLREKIVRLHVVAASDSPEDQALKLRVRDAVIECLREAMGQIRDPEQARVYLQEHLPEIGRLADQVLSEAGSEFHARVSLGLENFGKRVYDTFSLPSGVYDALRITIGPGEGHNWWCVVFPALCLPVTAEDFEEVAAGAGFSDSMIRTLQEDPDYEIRFYFLDLLGKLENFLRRD